MTGPPELSGARVRGVVFDLDGTLIDGYDGVASGVNAARAAFGLGALSADELRGRVGRGLSHLMEEVVGPEKAAEAVQIFRGVYDRVCVDQTRPAPALRETLAALRTRRYRLSVASNKPAPYSRRILDRLGVSSMFDAIEGPETAGKLKPDPAMIDACLSAMNVRSDEALYVGDMELDVEAAARAGVAVVLVCGGSSSKEALAGTGHPVLATLSELLEVLPPR
jgi:phosphoglycolate phosphatase